MLVCIDADFHVSLYKNHSESILEKLKMKADLLARNRVIRIGSETQHL